MSPKQIILMTAFIDVLGVSIVIPILPFYVESFGVSAFVVTVLFSVFSLCSFLSAPYLGALSDKIGRRPVLLISIASTALGWLVFASAHSIVFLFVGRIIDGLAAGNMPIAQSYLADLAKDEKERIANLGLIGSIFGIAFIIGPVLGGWLGTFSHALPFWVVGILASLNLILAFINLPESHLHRDAEKKLSVNPFAPILGIYREKELIGNYVVWFIFGLALASQQSVFALYLDKVFGYGSAVAGSFMAGVGVILVINQGLLLKHFWLRYFEEQKLALTLFFVFGLGYLITAIPNIYFFIIGLLCMTMGQSVLRVILTSLTIRQNVKKRGEILGVLASIMFLSMVFGPLLAGALFEIKAYYPFIAAGLFSLLGFSILYYSMKKKNALLPVQIES